MAKPKASKQAAKTAKAKACKPGESARYAGGGLTCTATQRETLYRHKRNRAKT